MVVNNFLAFIAQTPQPIGECDMACPICGGELKQDGGTETTLIGWSGKGHDPNHATTPFVCTACLSFLHLHSKSGNHWMTNSASHVLRGVASCFETFTHTHADCGGTVSRRYARLDSDEAPGYLSWSFDGSGGKVKSYRVFYACAKCGDEIETADDYWRGA